MPTTLRSLVADRTLGLRPLCRDAQLDVAVSWVHISEVADPTPYLTGGELLLITGLAIDGRTDVAAFVARLADRGLAGLGFGTGLSHDTVPDALVVAARERGLALLEIPERTPFIAITKAASTALAADAYAQVVRTDEAQRALTAAAFGHDGTARVLRRLAERLEAWVLLLDAAGAVEHAVPRHAVEHLAELAVEIGRIRRHRGPTSATVSGKQGWAVLQPLRLRGRGVLAVGRTAAFDPADHQIVGSAVAILTLLHASTATVERARRTLRIALMRLLMAGETATARPVAAELWGPQPAPPLRVVVVRGRAGALGELAEAVEAAGAEHGPLFSATVDGALVAVVNADGAAGHWLLARVAARDGTSAGVSDPVASVPDGEPQAAAAAAAAERDGVPLRHFADLARAGLLDLLPSADGAAFAGSVLAPLLRHDATGRGELVRSLREWLAEHGQWEPAAARLGVHRHTLRQRIRRVEALLERPLDRPGVRAELWFALQLLDGR